MNTCATVSENRGIGRQDLNIAAAVACTSALFFSWQILGMPDDVGQFLKYPSAVLGYNSGTITPERLTDFSPLYLWLHVASERIMENPLQAMHWAHVILLSLTSMLLYLLIRRHAGMFVSLSGAAAFVLGRSVAVYGYVFEPEPLMMFLLAALVFFAGRRGPLSSLAAGTSLALCLMTRPSFFPLVFLVPIHYLLRCKDRRKVLISSVFFLIPVAAGMILIAGRNYSLTGSFSLLVMSPGTVFFDGNNPLSSGTRVAYPPVVGESALRHQEEIDYQHVIYRLFARKIAERDLSLGETNSFWAEKAFNFIVDHPGNFLLRTVRRVFYLFHSYRWHDIQISWKADEALSKRVFPHLPFGVVSALALLGLGLCLRSWRIFFLPFAIFLNQAALMSLTYATDRQRVCLYTFFIFFAAIALDQVLQHIRFRRIALAALAMLIPLFTVENSLMREDRHISEGYLRAEPLMKEAVQDIERMELRSAYLKSAQAAALQPWTIGMGRLAELPASQGMLADQALRELPGLRKENPSTRLDRAMLLIESGSLDEAERILSALDREGERFDREEGRLPEPSYYLGRISSLRGRPDKAAALMLRAAQKAPGDPEILAQLACLTGERKFSDQIFRYFDNLDAFFFLGRACLMTGHPDQAASYLNQLAAALPEYRRGLIYTAAALGGTGRYVQAASAYLAAAGSRPRMVLLEDMIVPVFDRWARDGSPEAIYWHGVVLRQYGRFPEALRILEQAEASGNRKAGAELTSLMTVMEQAGFRRGEP